MQDNTRPSGAAKSELEPELESAVWAVLAEPIPTAAIERVKARADQLQPQRVHRLPLSNRPVIRRRWLQVAAIAAGVLVLVGAAMLLPPAPSAYAQVIQRLKAAGAFRYIELVYLSTQEAPVEVKVMVAADGRERRDMLGNISIQDASGRIRLTLITDSKTAIVHKPSTSEPTATQRRLEWLDHLKSHGEKPDKHLGVKTIDERRCQGFEVKIMHVTYSIWIDDHTRELIQIEFVGMPEGSPVTKCVMKGFRFNQVFDEAMFQFEAPRDYAVTESAVAPKQKSNEQSLIDALRGYTQLSDGRFPKSISDWGEWAVLMANKGGSSPEGMQVMTSIGSVLPFLMSMSKDDYEYLGAGRTIDEQRTIVFWYRKPDRTLRAIYSDFSVADIAESDLPNQQPATSATP